MGTSKKLSLKVYRHKEEKDVFLLRNWGLCWMSHFNGELYVKYKKKLDVEIDGYTGTLEKEIKLYVRDFERVILTED